METCKTCKHFIGGGDFNLCCDLQYSLCYEYTPACSQYELKEKFYKISEKELLSLLKDSARLAALESGGVDNWDWYGASCSEFLSDVAKEEGISEEEIDNFGFKDVAKIDLKNYQEVDN